MLQIRSDVQAIFDQMNDLSFKFFTMFAEWQQKKGKHQQSSSVQNQIDEEGVTVSKGQNQVNLKPTCIDVPRFENSDPQGWIFKILQYFDFHNVTKEQHLQIAPLYFDGKVLAWYQ